MNTSEQEAVFTLCLMAAFADGAKADLERAELRRIADSLASTGLNAAAAYQTVLLRRPAVAEVASALLTQEVRQLGYEMAVCVCDADGVRNDAERQFLASLAQALQIATTSTASVTSQADALAVAPVNDAALPAALVPPQGASDTAPDTERMILNYAILNGALELLPDSLATLAIIPLQLKMVYRIGRQHGFELDRGHIKEFVATAGLGLTSQVVEGYARKLVGGLLGKVMGGIGRTVGKHGASSAMSFATTYALGHAARQYYAGGRRLSAVELRQLFGSLSSQAQTLYSRYAGDIERKAGEVNVRELLPLLRQ
jgi:uncharacterized protein (DUF697 family)/tellurite resistance protein